MRVIWYTAMSMDGRIASPSGSLDFLETLSSAEPSGASPNDFSGFLAGIDAVVVGGATLRWLIDGGHGWPHADLPTWLFSRDAALTARLPTDHQGMQQRAGAVEPVFAEIAATGASAVWLCGGGDLAGQVLAADLIDEVHLTIAPTALGAGPALFDLPDLPRRGFELIELRRFGAHGARLVYHRTATGRRPADP